MAAKALCEKKSVKQVKVTAKQVAEPKRLSKFGEWMERHPNGIGKILDMRAVMR